MHCSDFALFDFDVWGCRRHENFSGTRIKILIAFRSTGKFKKECRFYTGNSKQGNNRLSEKNHPNWEHIRKEQESVSMHTARMIKTDDLPLEDGIHFTPESYSQIGIRMAKALGFAPYK